MINDDKLYIISQKLSELLKSKSIPFKESDKQFSILCPSCLKDGKTKLKLNIDKKSFIYHCFRCGIKGSALTLPSVLSQLGLTELQHLFLDIITDVKFLKQQKKSFFQIYNNINDEFDNINNVNLYKSQIKKSVESNFKTFNKCCSNSVDIKNLIKSYLQIERTIEPYQLKIHNITHLYGTSDKLNCRFIVPTYLYTNYEARTITNSINRYMKEDKSNGLLYDFVFINLVNGKQDNPFKRKRRLKLPYVIVTEGLFDAIKLGLMGFPTISSGGVENFNKILLFLLILNKIYNIEVKNILYMYDNDIDISKIENVRDDICFSFSKYYNFIFSRFNYENYKDIGDIPPDKMFEFITELDNVLCNFK